MGSYPEFVRIRERVYKLGYVWVEAPARDVEEQERAARMAKVEVERAEIEARKVAARDGGDLYYTWDEEGRRGRERR